MPITPNTPKYAEIVNALQRRIEQGTYRVGDLLPSESQLVREFGASRSTVVRALEFLRQHGWLEGVQGKGRIVLPRGHTGAPIAPERVRRLLRPDTFADVELLGVGLVRAPAHVAIAMSVPSGSPLIARHRLLTAADARPAAVSVAYLPANLAQGTELAAKALLVEGLVDSVRRSRGLVARHVVERLGARRPSTQEAAVLQTDRQRCAATVLLTVLDAADRPLFAVDTIVARTVGELTATFALA
ncbi:GntR family transcriptional regulator [Dactylosporangium sucinum]|uniref:GntR family transcriptional regulator n=1 Tax=Dactylosporangium sucinum TaxID=1424081 RepID=UPI00167D3886|nr:GntR family transcriptional regulator [Dactylosporangium sucinum]